ncbi:hypothetical protein E1267_02010 [Nonomuraea longispora]|uniref:DUF732 domain-containing protein n=1 Tax=Nonomuraea longispora TaxID=1848320 RepID=A0A4V2XLM2_9ACTN|nr:hypothetical protein [Nonomuraea longispora]TDC10996.1 hypothetical protein E1267_02010 [Nonomuraea longispora]
MRIAAMGLAAVLVWGSAACATGRDNSESNFLTATQADQEYLAEARRWQLPDGLDWPRPPIHEEKSNVDGAPMVYEAGYGAVMATEYWYCSWGRALVDAEDGEERSRALAEVLKLPQTAYFQNIENPDSDVRMLTAAQAGDYTHIAADLQLNCADQGNRR